MSATWMLYDDDDDMKTLGSGSRDAMEKLYFEVIKTGVTRHPFLEDPHGDQFAWNDYTNEWDRI